MAIIAGSAMWRVLEAHVLLLLLLTGPALQCGPGRGAGRLRRPRKMTPLVFKQHVPNVSENTLGASGPAKGAITRSDPKFKDLVTNYNPDITFKDEEGSGSDRIMSQRCKDKLNTLAIAVMNRWPNVKLRVTEAWDEDSNHSKDSLHYEGRAVDITTSDRDRSKYGMLARLAVEAGFDWVYYDTRSHIHVSVKSDSSITIKTGGCFAGTGMVQLADGHQRPLANVSSGEKVLAMLPDGTLDYSEIYMFLDVDTTTMTSFVTVETESGVSLTVTPNHLVYVTESRDVPASMAVTSFAQHLRAGQYLYVAQKNKTLTPTRISAIEAHTEVGYYAPLTKHGTIVVDDVAASCYAFIDSPTIAHWSLAPLRMYHSIWDVFRRKLGLAAQAQESYIQVNRGHDEGVHWYAEMLHFIGRFVLTDSHWFRL